jgi:hypothetical protein
VVGTGPGVVAAGVEAGGTGVDVLPDAGSTIVVTGAAPVGAGVVDVGFVGVAPASTEDEGVPASSPQAVNRPRARQPIPRECDLMITPVPSLRPQGNG